MGRRKQWDDEATRDKHIAKAKGWRWTRYRMEVARWDGSAAVGIALAEYESDLYHLDHLDYQRKREPGVEIDFEIEDAEALHRITTCTLLFCRLGKAVTEADYAVAYEKALAHEAREVQVRMMRDDALARHRERRAG